MMIADAARIFVTYRREDSEYAVGALVRDLRLHFGEERVFQDVASIAPGADFEEALKRALDASSAVLVVIGPRWLSITDEEGRRRLDLPDDWVRREVTESLARADVRVFPLLLDTKMPKVEQLPEPLRPLTRRQAFPVTARHWGHDVADLVKFLDQIPPHPRVDAASERIANAAREDPKSVTQQTINNQYFVSYFRRWLTYGLRWLMYGLGALVILLTVWIGFDFITYKDPRTPVSVEPLPDEKTYKVCIGQYRERCGPTAEFLPCGSSVEKWADAKCQLTTKIDKLSDKPGNMCGYLTAQVVCVPKS